MAYIVGWSFILHSLLSANLGHAPGLGKVVLGQFVSHRLTLYGLFQERF